MNKKHFYLLLRSSLPVIGCYLILCGLVDLLIVLYNLPSILLGDLFRFSLPLLIVYLIASWSFSSYKSSRLNLNRIEDFTPTNTTEAKLSTLLKDNQRDTNTTIHQLRLTQQNQFDHLELLVHEIKNYLTSLNAAAENGSTVSSKEVKANVHQANYYLNLLLSDERLAMDNNDFAFQWVNLEQLVNEVIQQNSAIFINKQLTPILHNLKNITVLTDRKWLRFCIEQLLSNAIKYSATSTIDISWEINSLKIKDYGIGILTDDLPRIFENGFTGHNGHQTTLSTGMGLYLVKKVTDQLNFTINVTSTIGEGTTASLTFNSDNYKV
ncbi:sensor histidine kinase [Limosilactobacillus sp. STM2_1]|uniref:histidine kinase n=1 Tax=Limosilactobacillus rudii TaxID=2759755 RepID=A0A7W3UKT1_9LACO|nr:sensor histidine kinase [Limosilactobacillus rudii]MBB1079353.1 sensor histidine kinase [Limosilactobacillus rudii]MBB1097399.1 sensor histidine kinase [Limosilactobacillus rudii]MCD7134508.1 sensor histidine kinase [Limosilactobacillus rudii]